MLALVSGTAFCLYLRLSDYKRVDFGRTERVRELFCLGDVFCHQHKIEQAIEEFNKSIDIYIQLANAERTQLKAPLVVILLCRSLDLTVKKKII